MVSAVLIAVGYMGLIATCGWWGLAGAAIHVAVLVAASALS